MAAKIYLRTAEITGLLAGCAIAGGVLGVLRTPISGTPGAAAQVAPFVHPAAIAPVKPSAEISSTAEDEFGPHPTRTQRHDPEQSAPGVPDAPVQGDRSQVDRPLIVIHTQGDARGEFEPMPQPAR